MSSITLDEIEARVAQVNDAATQPMRANALELLSTSTSSRRSPPGRPATTTRRDVAMISAMAARALKAKPQLDLESAR